MCSQCKEPDFPVLRAGLHRGRAVERGADVFGAAVNLAARIASSASGGEVLATAASGLVSGLCLTGNGLTQDVGLRLL